MDSTASTPSPVSPPPAPDPADPVELLRVFLVARDVPCPLCDYNLRDLAATTCPECSHVLDLTVGVRTLPLGRLVAALIPGIFSGMCAFFVSIAMVAGWMAGSPPPSLVVGFAAFGWLSGFASLALFRFRYRFVRWRPQRQTGWVFATWSVHVVAFLVLLAILFS